MKFHSLELVDHEIQLGFDNLSLNEILEKFIPPEIGIPSGYETVGHIAHFNLKPQVFQAHLHIICISLFFLVIPVQKTHRRSHDREVQEHQNSCK